MYISVVGIENLYINGFEIVRENKRLVSGFLATNYIIASVALKIFIGANNEYGGQQ